MPIYSYRCSKCGNHSEIIHKSSDTSQHFCDICNAELERTISPVAVIFKGSGFHKNDYAHGSFQTSSQEKSSDTKNTETKSESKPEAKSDSVVSETSKAPADSVKSDSASNAA